MADNSSLVIAYSNGSGGSQYTVNYSRKKGLKSSTYFNNRYFNEKPVNIQRLLAFGYVNIVKTYKLLSTFFISDNDLRSSKTTNKQK